MSTSLIGCIIYGYSSLDLSLCFLDVSWYFSKDRGRAPTQCVSSSGILIQNLLAFHVSCHKAKRLPWLEIHSGLKLDCILEKVIIIRRLYFTYLPSCSACLLQSVELQPLRFGGLFWSRCFLGYGALLLFLFLL